jgi:small multidrug resistance family-3 protein
MSTNLGIFALAAFFEIAGCFAFWLWIRRDAAAYVPVLGVASLIGFAVALTRVDSAFAGRAYAAYGGIYIVASLMWLWLIEGQRPTMTDLMGSALAIGGALVIISFATKAP